MKKVNYEYSSYDSSIDLFRKIKASEVTDDDVKAYYDTEGIQFLRKHMKHYGGNDLTYIAFKNLIDFSLSDKKSNNRLVNSFRFAYNNFSRINKLSLNFDNILHEAYNRASSKIPTDMNVAYKIHLLYGIRGTAIVLGNEIALDLADKFLYVDGQLSSEKIVCLLAHEIHHIFIDTYKAELIKRAESKEHAYIERVSELMSEGIATYYFTDEKKELFADKKDKESLLDEINLVINSIENGQEIELYDENGLGYKVGYWMTSIILEIYDEDVLMSSLSDCREYIKLYKQAVRDVGEN